MEENSYTTLTKALAGHRVMLVGGAGFIGHNFALELRRLGVETMVVDHLGINNLVANVYAPEISSTQRRVYQQFLLERFELMRDAKVELRNVDARLMMDLQRAFDEFRPTKVVHLSAISSAVDARRDPGLCFDLQLITLRNLIEACRLNHQQVDQVMLLSSSTVYGDFEGDTVDESTRPRPKGIYANAKYMAERLLRTYRDQHGLGVTIIRPSALYGERCISRRVSQVFIENALTGKPLLLEGGGSGKLDFTYIDDLIEGMVRALGRHEGRNWSNTYNLTFGNARSIADLAAIVKSVIPEAILEERPRAEDKPIRGTWSTHRAEEVLGFKARWTLEEGYRRYCEWYVDHWRKASG
jgi:nucleoside-diphosphate-sugar epimerase